MSRVLLVDDETPILHVSRVVLRQDGLTEVDTCSDSRRVLGMLEREHYGVIVLDLTMPHLNGEELLVQLQEHHAHIPVIVMTGLNDVETAVRCMRAGAADYMVKPVEPSRLCSGIRRVLELSALRDEVAALSDRMLATDLSAPDAFQEMVTQNARMFTLFRYIEAVAPASRPVLILGETGTGKDLFARAVHRASGRKGEFVVVNAAGLDDHVFSDTLFGHKRGAFTGADRDRPGLIARAAEGTLFLDEIGDLSPTSQVKLLRLLQNGEYLPLGSDKALKSTARIVAATNMDLRKRQEEGQFRADLFYRLQGHTVAVPPLRERLNDLPLLLEHFCGLAAHDLKKRKPTLPPELLTLLGTHSFPGNIRELEAMVFDAVSRHTSRMMSMEVFEAHIRGNAVAQAPIDGAPEGAGFSFSFSHFESLPTPKAAQQLLLSEALRRAGGNQSIAARLLGITQSGLSKALKRQREADGD